MSPTFKRVLAALGLILCGYLVMHLSCDDYRRLAVSRKRTGLRNKYRSGGRSKYSVAKKSREADRYGTYKGRTCDTQDVVAGRSLMATQDPQSPQDGLRRARMGIIQ